MVRNRLIRSSLAMLAVCLTASPAFAAITINIEMNPDPPRPGEAIRILATVANNGVSSVASVQLRATVPAGVSGAHNTNYMSIGPTGCNTGATSQCDPGDVMTFSIGTMPAGTVTTVSMAFFVAPTTTAGTVITLAADALASAVVVASTTDSVTVDDDNALSLAVDDGPDGVSSPGTLTYTLVYGNRGSVAVTGATLTLPLPAGATLVSATGGGIAGGGSVAWNLGNLAAGQSGRQQAVVTLPGALVAGTVLEPAPATVTGTALGPELAQAEALTAIGGGQLGLAVEANPDPVRSDERLRTEFTVTNRTGADLTGVTLRARVPESVASFSPNAINAASVGNCNLTGTSNCDAVDLISVSIGSLAAGSAVTITLPPVVATATPSGHLLTWEVLVFANGNLQSAASRAVPVDNDNALTLAADESVDAVAPGATLAYDLTYGNRGTDPVTGATLSFPVPAGTTVADAGGGTVSGNAVSFSLGTLNSGESGRRQVVVTVGAGLGAGTLLAVDAATLSGMAAGPETARGSAATSVRANQEIGLAIDADPDPVRSNERMHATVTVTNRTALQLGSVVLKVRVPDRVVSFSPSYVNSAPTNCSLTGTSLCDGGDILQFSLGNLAAGASAVLMIPPVVADATADGMLLEWEATVTAFAVVGSRSSTLRRAVAVDNGNALALGLDENADPVAPGGTLTYSLVYGNRGIAAVPGTTLVLPLPAGVSFVSASDGGTLVDGKVQWTLGGLAAGQAGRRQATVVVDGGLTDGALLVVDSASLTGSGANAENARANAATAVRAGATLGIGIEANPDPVRQGEQLRTEIAVLNHTGSALINLRLKARVPENVVSFSGTYPTGNATACNITGSSLCDSGDIVEYTVAGNPGIAPNTGIVYSLPPFIANGTESGRVLSWEAIATTDSGHVATMSYHFAVDNDNALTLAIDDSPNATPANGALTYVLTYGNRSAAPITGATLQFPLPEGTTLLSSTGGTLSGGTVNFNLGTIAAGQGGRRQLRVQLGAGLPAGSLIYQRGLQVSGTSAVTGLEQSRAAEVTPVEAAATLPGLVLTTQLTPDPALPGTALTGTVRISNNSGGLLSNVVARVRVPDFVASFAGTTPTLVISQGSVVGCSLTGPSSNCDPTDKISWNLGNLASAAEATLTFTTSVASGAGQPGNGQVLAVYADANDQPGTFALGYYASSTDAMLVGAFTDPDTDGIPTVYDNCLNVANPDQLDADYDGFGNLCDADLNQSGLVTTTDFNLLRTVLNQAASSGPLAAAADFNGSGTVTSNDFLILRSLLNLPPGPSALAP